MKKNGLTKHNALNLRSKSFLQSLFKKLEDDGIRYCVLHSYEKILDEPVGDIDLSIMDIDRNNLWEIIYKVAKEINIKPIQKFYYDIPYGVKYIFSTGYPEQPRIELDFLQDNKGINRYLIDSSTLIYNRNKFRGFYIANNEIEFIYYFIKKIKKREIKDETRKRLAEIYDKNRHNCIKLLIDYFGLREFKIAEKLLFDNDLSKNQVENIIYKLNKSLYYKQWIMRPGKILYAILYLFKRTWHRVSKPEGLVISFLSPDGGGKSTLAGELAQAIGWAFDGRIQRLHWRPGLLPFPHRLLKPKEWKEPEPAKTDPHGGPDQSGLLSLCRFFYYTADYLLGFIPKILWPKIRFNLVILDRYYYDFLIDRRRFNLNIPEFLPRLFLPLIPKPDMVFLLTGDPEEIYNRKKELRLEEIERQISEMKILARKLPNAYEINTSRPLPDVVEEIKEIIINYLAERLRRREEEKS